MHFIGYLQVKLKSFTPLLTQFVFALFPASASHSNIYFFKVIFSLA